MKFFAVNHDTQNKNMDSQKNPELVENLKLEKTGMNNAVRQA